MSAAINLQNGTLKANQFRGFTLKRPMFHYNHFKSLTNSDNVNRKLDYVNESQETQIFAKMNLDMHPSMAS